MNSSILNESIRLFACTRPYPFPSKFCPPAQMAQIQRELFCCIQPKAPYTFKRISHRLWKLDESTELLSKLRRSILRSELRKGYSKPVPWSNLQCSSYVYPSPKIRKSRVYLRWSQVFCPKFIYLDQFWIDFFENLKFWKCSIQRHTRSYFRWRTDSWELLHDQGSYVDSGIELRRRRE